jgi:hypothetical protein
MESTPHNKKMNDIAFYFLMSILGFTVLSTLGFLVYAVFFG